MIIPRQLSLGEVIGQKKGKAQPKPRLVSLGRPRRELDVELLRMLRAKGYGYKRIAGEYTKVTGEYISHTTVRERLVGGRSDGYLAGQALGMGHRFLLREHRTQPGTLEYNCGNFRVR